MLTIALAAVALAAIVASVWFLAKHSRADGIAPAKPHQIAPFYLLKPEVAGGWGPNTQARRDMHPPLVTHLDYQFEGWLGDDLLETFPEFVVTERLGAALENSELTGFRLARVDVSAGDMWQQLFGSRPVPQCRWLQMSGRAGDGDFGRTALAELVVSDKALSFLGGFTLAQCEVRPWTA